MAARGYFTSLAGGRAAGAVVSCAEGRAPSGAALVRPARRFVCERPAFASGGGGGPARLRHPGRAAALSPRGRGAGRGAGALPGVCCGRARPASQNGSGAVGLSGPEPGLRTRRRGAGSVCTALFSAGAGVTPPRVPFSRVDGRWRRSLAAAGGGKRAPGGWIWSPAVRGGRLSPLPARDWVETGSVPCWGWGYAGDRLVLKKRWGWRRVILKNSLSDAL